MNKVISFCLLCFLSLNAFAQFKTDSIAYNRQRAKINAMLAERSKKFGRYDQSLTQRSGIFGFQTKNDIRRSNDILMDIVKTDNDIYRELKILLDYRTFQQNQAQDQSKETEQTATESMYTISKLQDQVVKLRKQNEDYVKLIDKESLNFKIIVFLLVIIILFLLRNQIHRKETKA